MTVSTCSRNGVSDHLHATFLALLPRIELHATISFRDIKCPHKQADKIAETVALAWKWLLRLHQQGKDVNEFAVVFINLVAKAVKSGRRVCGQEQAKDVLSPLAQQRHSFKVERLPSSTCTAHENLFADVNGQRRQDALEETLQDNTQTPVPEQAAFRVDFPAWRLTRTERDRRVIDDLMQGERTGDVADRYGLSAGRISQLRSEFCDDWCRFCGDTEPLPLQPSPALA